MTTRSARPEVRNPILSLPAAQLLSTLAPDAREALREILLDLAADARRRAEESWRRHKAPMAVYWKCVAVYARHIANAIPRRPLRRLDSVGRDVTDLPGLWDETDRMEAV